MKLAVERRERKLIMEEWSSETNGEERNESQGELR